MSRIGRLPIPVPGGVDVTIDGPTLSVTGPKGTLSHTVASPITVELVGVGYRVQARGWDLEFALGYSHPVPVRAPEGIPFTVESRPRLRVTGIDKQLVGQVAANIRGLRRPDPYKGKGVRYQGEVVKRKVGKTGK